MQGKSVGFLRLKSHAPSSHEIAANPAMAQLSRVIDEWLLIEYAVTFLPVNQAALVEAVSKSGIAPAGLQAPGIEPPPPETPPIPRAVAFLPESEVHRAIERRIAAFDFEAVAKRAIAEGIERATGRV
jgi:hypothetical protein